MSLVYDFETCCDNYNLEQQRCRCGY